MEGSADPEGGNPELSGRDSAPTLARMLATLRTSFPETVNEVAARVVAGVVAVTSLVILLTGAHWLLVPLAYGFVARVLAGPRFSPLALLATKVVVPRLPVEPKIVAGSPKRFAQGIGATLSTAALVSWLAGAPTAAAVLVSMIATAATLEAAFAYCLGCKVYGLLVRAGVVTDPTCLDCADITRRATI